MRLGNYQRGEARYNTKLTEQQVRTIRQAFEDGVITLSGISVTWGISYASAWDIVNYRRWQHVR